MMAGMRAQERGGKPPEKKPRGQGHRAKREGQG
jgi:hypothetical protein